MTPAHGMWHGFGPGPFEWLWAFVPIALMIVFWSLVVVLVAKLVKNRPQHRPDRSAGLQVLEERYARGEISRDEFLERREVLSEAKSPGSRST